jgi:IclR family pca regulon transcriptional regulator
MLSPVELDRVLKLQSRSEFVATSATSKQLEAMLAKIRSDGFVLIDSLISEGLRIISVPVLDPDRHPIGAVSIAAPSVRCSKEQLMANALGPLRTAAKDIARALEANGSVASVFKPAPRQTRRSA